MPENIYDKLGLNLTENFNPYYDSIIKTDLPTRIIRDLQQKYIYKDDYNTEILKNTSLNVNTADGSITISYLK